MLANVNPGANGKGIYVPPREGAGKVLVQNPPDAEVTLYVHQGFDLEYGEVTAGTREITDQLTVAHETIAETGALAPGESVVLNTSRAVWVHTGAQNAAAQVNITFLG